MKIRVMFAGVVFALIMAWPGLLKAVTFLDQTDLLGQGTIRNNYSAAAWTDYDNDGDQDLLDSHYFYTNSCCNSLTYYRGFWGPGIWGDYNNDGFSDLYVWEKRGYLYRNNNGESFTMFHGDEVLAERITVCDGACWGDFNNDGFLDIYATGYELSYTNETGYSDFVMMNNAGESFTLQERADSDNNRARGVTGCDFDMDGDLDLYVSCYRLRANNLLLNDGSGSFTDVAAAYGVDGDGVTYYDRGHTIGSAWGDMDNDGYIDLFVANFSHPDLSQDRPKYMRNMGPSGGFHFQQMGEIAGAEWQESYASAAMADYDNDGDLDLFFTTVYSGNSSRLWRNDGNWTFTDITDSVGLSGITNTYAAAWVDFDNDGDLDLTSDGRIFINQGTGNNWLRVKLEGNGVTVNRSAIGAQVRIDMGGGVIQTRQVEGATGKGSQNELTMHFGMGARTASVDLEILWPGGETQIVTDVALNQTLEVTQPQHMTLSVSSLTPAATRGEDSATQFFDVANAYKNPMDFTITDDAEWLSVSPSSGICRDGDPQTAQVTYDTDSMTTGVYNAVITVSSDGATNAPQTIAVSLSVVPQPGDLPIAESFESYAVGMSLAGFNGWEGALNSGVITSLTYTAQTPPGYPLPEQVHSKVLQVSDTIIRSVNGVEEQSVNFDFMVQASRSETLGVPPEEAQFAFMVDSNGFLCVWHMCNSGSGWEKRWTDMGMPAIPEGEWVRVSATMDYATSPANDTFFRPRVNGSLCPSPSAFKAPDNLTVNGTWYMCADSPGRGGSGSKLISGVAIDGNTLFDDLSVSMEPFAHTGETSINGVPFSWFDEWGVARYPDIDFDGDGFDAGDEYAAGTDPADADSSFKIVDIRVANDRVYLSFLGNDSGDETPYIIERSTNGLSSGWITVDPAVPRATAPETVNTWSESLPPLPMPSFYRLRVPSTE